MVQNLPAGIPNRLSQKFRTALEVRVQRTGGEPGPPSYVHNPCSGEALLQEHLGGRSNYSIAGLKAMGLGSSGWFRGAPRGVVA